MLPRESLPVHAEEFLTDESFLEWVRRPSAQGEVYWQDFLARFPERQAALLDARRLALDLREEPGLDSAAIDEAWLRFREHAAPVPAAPEANVRPLWRRIGGWAAAAAVLLVLGWTGWHWANRPEEITVSAPSGIRTFELPDGSAVTLNRGAELRYQSDQPRLVSLRGEAHFNVRHTPRHETFHVRTPETAIEVLGTVFNVSSTARRTAVVLREGSVRVRALADTGRPVLLRPGERAFCSPDSANLTVQSLDASISAAWTEGTIRLRNTSLRDLSYFIEDHYQKRVRFANPSLARLTLTGTLPLADERLFLESVAAVLGIRVEVANEVVAFQ